MQCELVRCVYNLFIIRQGFTHRNATHRTVNVQCAFVAKRIAAANRRVNRKLFGDSEQSVCHIQNKKKYFSFL